MASTSYVAVEVLGTSPPQPARDCVGRARGEQDGFTDPKLEILKDFSQQQILDGHKKNRPLEDCKNCMFCVLQ